MKINWDKTLQFIKGYAFAIITTSTLALAVSTNIPGFNIFTSGTPISSSAVNDNFGKVAGVIIFEGTNTSAFTIDNTALAASACDATDDCSYGLFEFDNITLGGANHTTATDSNGSTLSSGNDFSVITVPTSGWYEVFLNYKVTSMVATASGTNDSSMLDSSYILTRWESGGSYPIYSSASLDETELASVYNSQSYYDANSNSTFDDPTSNYSSRSVGETDSLSNKLKKS